MYRFGHLITLILIGCSSFVASCLLWSLTYVHPVVACIGIILKIIKRKFTCDFLGFGIGFGTLQPCIWTGVQAVVPERSIGPAYAILGSNVAIIALAVPYGAGALHDYYNCKSEIESITFLNIKLTPVIAYDPVAWACAGNNIFFRIYQSLFNSNFFLSVSGSIGFMLSLILLWKRNDLQEPARREETIHITVKSMFNGLDKKSLHAIPKINFKPGDKVVPPPNTAREPQQQKVPSTLSRSISLPSVFLSQLHNHSLEIAVVDRKNNHRRVLSGSTDVTKIWNKKHHM